MRAKKVAKRAEIGPSRQRATIAATIVGRRTRRPRRPRNHLVPAVSIISLRDKVEIGGVVLCCARRGDLNHAVTLTGVAPAPVAVVFEPPLALLFGCGGLAIRMVS